MLATGWIPLRQCFGLDTHIVINQTKKKKICSEDATAEASRRRIRDKIISKDMSHLA